VALLTQELGQAGVVATRVEAVVVVLTLAALSTIQIQQYSLKVSFLDPLLVLVVP